MAKLGYTWYPKDWWTSDTFYELPPELRYVYIEILSMMYVNDGEWKGDRTLLLKRFGVDVGASGYKLLESRFLVGEDGVWTHRSVSIRLKKTVSAKKNGLKGGAPKGNNNARKKGDIIDDLETTENNPKTTLKQPETTLKQPQNNLKTTEVEKVVFVNPCESTEKQPKQPKKTTQNNLLIKYNRNIKEIEREGEGESKKGSPPSTSDDVHFPIENLKADYLKNERVLQALSKNQKIPIEKIKSKLDEFVETLEESNKLTKTTNDFATHFRFWLLKSESDPAQQKPQHKLKKRPWLEE